MAIFEIGLGGRLDAVNLLDSDCAVLTSIDLDHENFLGNTRKKLPGKKFICKARKAYCYC